MLRVQREVLELRAKGYLINTNYTSKPLASLPENPLLV